MKNDLLASNVRSLISLHRVTQFRLKKIATTQVKVCLTPTWPSVECYEALLEYDDRDGSLGITHNDHNELLNH